MDCSDTSQKMRTKSKIRCEWSNNVLPIWQKCTANTRNTSKYGNSQHNRKALHSAQRTTQRPSRGHNKVMNLAGVQCFVTITQPLVSSVFDLTFFVLPENVSIVICATCFWLCLFEQHVFTEEVFLIHFVFGWVAVQWALWLSVFQYSLLKLGLT